MGCNTSLVCCIFTKKDIRNRTAWINAEPKFQYGCHGVNWDTNRGVNWDTFCKEHFGSDPTAIKAIDNYIRSVMSILI